MWAVGLSVVTTVGLGVLTWGLGVMHAMSYGAIAVVSPESMTAPEPDRYALALTVGATVSLTGALLVAWVVSRTPARGWPPLAQGTVAALVALVAGAWALLHVLGVGLVGFAAAFWG
jgi:hypothetical protein